MVRDPWDAFVRQAAALKAKAEAATGLTAEISFERPDAPVRPSVRRTPGGGRVVAVMAGKGGSGKTVTATNLAMALTMQRGDGRVVIVDTDLQFGDVALLLQMDPSRTLLDVSRRIDEISDAKLESMLLRHESGLRVLPAPVLPVSEEEVPAKVIAAVVDRLRALYDIVVIDTPPIFDDHLITVLEQADEVEQRSRALSEAINARAEEVSQAIARAQMPVPGLGFGDGAVTLGGLPFEQASDAEKLEVSLGIAIAANPKVRVIRIRDGSLLDDQSLATVAQMARENNCQVWIERVDTTGKIGIVIEDGMVAAVNEEPVIEERAP